MAQQVASVPSPRFEGSASGKPPFRRGHQRDIYGALDLGTNNCRLLIARPDEGGFVVLDAFSRIVRLGDQQAAIVGAKVERAIDVALMSPGERRSSACRAFEPGARRTGDLLRHVTRPFLSFTVRGIPPG